MKRPPPHPPLPDAPPPVPLDRLGRAYTLSARSREDVRRRGQVFTPPEVVRLMLELAGLQAGSGARVLDPACGSGAILLGVAARLGAAGHLTGLELDPRPAALAAENLRGLGARASIRVGDALARAGELEGAFDLVLSNPPYVAWHRIDPAVRGRLEQAGYLGCPLTGRPRHQDQQPDLSLFFLLLGLHALRPGGRLVYLLPPEWLTASRAAALRRYLVTHATLLELVRFEGGGLFPEEGAARRAVGTGSMLIVAERRTPPPGHRVHLVRVTRFDPDSPDQIDRLVGRLRAEGDAAAGGKAAADWHLETVAQASLGAAPWRGNGGEGGWPAGAVPLASIPGVRVFGGHQPPVEWLTWLELGEADRAALPPAEREWLRPAARESRDITFPRLGRPARYWVFLPRGLPDETAVLGLAPVLHALMRGRLEAHVATRGEPIPARWWEFPNPRNLELFLRPGPKLLAPRTAPHLRVSLDPFQHMFKGTNTGIGIEPGCGLSPAVLFGLLNSASMRRWMAALGRPYHGTGVLQEPREVGRLPVPLEAMRAMPDRVRALEAAVERFLEGGEAQVVIDALAAALYRGAP